MRPETCKLLSERCLTLRQAKGANKNGRHRFPMLSVYKFPQAIAVADYCSRNNISLEDTIRISADEMKRDTWSPMRDTYGKREISLPLSDVLAYSVKHSDNNACDVLFRLIGGPQVAVFLSRCHPPMPLYRRLQQTGTHYRRE